MRKLALKQANALLRSMPAGVVIVKNDLTIIECNRHFAEIFGDDVVLNYDACPGMNGADIARIIPFSDLITEVLESGKDVTRDALRFGRKLFNISIFEIEPHNVAGAVIFDVTKTELRREQIASRAKEVIRKNLATVQEIACKLGENMADTEILLRSIADDYADEKELEKED